MSTNNGMDENQAPNSSRLSPRTRHPWPDLDAESTTSDPFSNAHAVNPSRAGSSNQQSRTGTPHPYQQSQNASQAILPVQSPSDTILPAVSPQRHYGTSSSSMQNSDRYDLSEYVIEQLHEYDDIDLVKPWHRWFIWLHPIVSCSVFLTYGAYFGYRVWCNWFFRRVQGGLNSATWIFIAAEGICIAPYFFWILLLLLCPQQRKRPKLRLRGDAVPAVDVMLTTCGEVVPMILDTALAACNIDYPTNRYRIIICDDDNDTALAEALQPMLAEYPQLFYQAREKIEGVPHHYKAGNLQFGIDFAAALEGGAGEFLATLDSDMIPHPEWLRALLPHLLRDEMLGLVSPPQTFYNVPVDDPLCQSICDFIHFMEVKKDAMGAAWCTGSGVVFKRFILEEMGGWPTASMAEDQLLSSMMNGMGYKAGYIHEFMQCGLIPESIINHLKQRTRWAVGTMEAAAALKWGLPGCKITKHMTFRQRWCVFTFAFNTLMTIPVFICYFIIPALLYWGHDLMVYNTLTQLRWQIRLGCIWVCTLRLNEIVVGLPSGYIQSQRSAMAYQFMAPYLAMAILRCYILPWWLGGKEIAFLASGAIRNKLKERYEKHRAGLWVRVKLMGWDCEVYVHLILSLVCLGAFGIDTWRAVRISKDAKTGGSVLALRHLLVNSMLPPVWWLMILIAFLVPVGYMFWPPTVPEREDLLTRDPKTGVAQPTVKEIKQVWGILPLVREVVWALTVCYCIVLFVGTFIY